MENSGLRDHLEQILSADDVQRLKPAPEPYRMAAESLGVEVEGIRLVAAHAWDVAGAPRAGGGAALVARPGVGVDPPVGGPGGVGAGPREGTDRILPVGSGEGRSQQR